ncbi:MAG TPA: hypothetical protein VGA73_15925 [Candidatus Binatia bacterium]
MKKIAAGLAAFVLLALSAPPLRAADPIEAAGVAVGLTAGNAVVIPAKAVSVGWGLISGALSFVLTGGNAELTAQIWRDVTEGPYLVTPDVALKAIGERPELNKKRAAPVETGPAPADSSGRP